MPDYRSWIMFSNMDTRMKCIYRVMIVGIVLILMHPALLYFAPTPLFKITQIQAFFMMITIIGPILCALYAVVYAIIFGFRRNWASCFKAFCSGVALLTVHICVFFVAAGVKTGFSV